MRAQISFLAVFLAASSCFAELTWTAWLGGPQRTGWVEGFQPPAEWPKELKKEWAVDVGTSYGSPLVFDGLVYLHTRQGEDEVVWCIDLASGETRWRKSHPVPFKMGQGGEWHGKGPKSSPVLAGGRLFTMAINGVLSAYDATTGEALWRKDYNQSFATKSGKATPYWGATTSPVVDDEKVYAHFGSDDKGGLYALSVKDGSEIWKQGSDGASYSSPLLVDCEGKRQLIEWNHEALVGVDCDSGELLWEYPYPHRETNQNMPTPTMHGNVILLGGENRGILGLKPTKDADGWTVKELWHQDKVALDMSSAVMNGEFLFGHSHYRQGTLFCLDIQNGEIAWQSPPRVGSNATFLSIPGFVVSLLDKGELQIIKASKSGYEATATYQVSDAPTWAPPVLLKDGLLIKDRTKLIRWSF